MPNGATPNSPRNLRKLGTDPFAGLEVEIAGASSPAPLEPAREIAAGGEPARRSDDSGSSSVTITGTAEPILVSTQLPGCPHLGTMTTTNERIVVPHAVHACYALEGPQAVTTDYKARYCLGGQHATCERFQTAERSKNKGAAGGASHGPGLRGLWNRWFGGK